MTIDAKETKENEEASIKEQKLEREAVMRRRQIIWRVKAGCHGVWKRGWKAQGEDDAKVQGEEEENYDTKEYEEEKSEYLIE